MSLPDGILDQGSILCAYIYMYIHIYISIIPGTYIYIYIPAGASVRGDLIETEYIPHKKPLADEKLALNFVNL